MEPSKLLTVSHSWQPVLLIYYFLWEWYMFPPHKNLIVNAVRSICKEFSNKRTPPEDDKTSPTSRPWSNLERHCKDHYPLTRTPLWNYPSFGCFCQSEKPSIIGSYPYSLSFWFPWHFHKFNSTINLKQSQAKSSPSIINPLINIITNTGAIIHKKSKTLKFLFNCKIKNPKSQFKL